MSTNQESTPLESSKVVVHESVRAAVEHHALTVPDAIALTTGGAVLTYRELNARANHLADQLCQQGVGPEVPVGLVCGRGAEAVVAWLAILKADGVCVPIDPALPADRLRAMVGLAGLRLVVTTHEMQISRPRLSGPTSVVRLEGPCPLTPNLLSRLRPTHSAQIHFTTGPNGHPRAVKITHAAAENLIRWQHSILPITPGTRVLQFAPPGLESAWQEVGGTLHGAGTLVVPTDAERASGESLLESMEKHRVTRAFLPAATLAHLAEAFMQAPRPLPHLRDIVAVFGPLPLSDEIRKFFSAHRAVRLHAHFASTETMVALAHTMEGDPEEWPQLAPLGRAAKGIRVMLIAADGKPAPEGEPGELCLGGSDLPRGYHRDPISTRERFSDDPFAAKETGAKIYHTGEIARLKPDGIFELVPRGHVQAAPDASRHWVSKVTPASDTRPRRESKPKRVAAA